MNKFLPILCLLIIVSCSKEVMDDQILIRQNLAYEVNSDTPFSGHALAYHPNGQLRSRVQLKNGLRNGLHEYFLENGQLLTRDSYKNGQREGLSEEYFLDGQLKSRDCWQQGKAVSISYCKK
ncbi:hypothetical protein N9A24_05865 [Gammaproteobacteria bacterium]|jgi:antitoxin component YwqK of YwqJK toxin-antitoxin module|nr:hypothetical protein [Gammaproteobacteria bacterium]